MPLDAAEAMLIGRLQQSVEGLERVVEGMRLAVHEFREATGEVQRMHETRIIALETAKVAENAHADGARAGFSLGQKVGFWGIAAAAAWGVKSGVVDLAALVSRIGK